MENSKVVENCNSVGTYYIFQMKEEKKDLRFFSRERVERMAGAISATWYNIMYAGTLYEGTTLDELYLEFNISRPEGFKGHSLSMGDVVVLVMQGMVNSYYVDEFGFSCLPDFFKEMDSGAYDFEYAFEIAGRNLLFQSATDGYDFNYYDANGRLMDGGIYDDTECPFIVALSNVMDDFKQALFATSSVKIGYSYCDVEDIPPFA